MNCQTTGQFIMQLRKEVGLTQAELAHRVGVSGAAVSKWERGKCYPDIEMVEKLAGIFSVSISEILSGCRIREYTEESVDTLAKSSISQYMRFVRNSIEKKAGIFILVVIIVSLLLVPAAARHLGNLQKSAFYNKYYGYENLYHSQSADVEQLVVQYDLNGEPHTIATSVLVEKGDDAIRSVNCVKSVQIEKGTSAFDYAYYCALDRESPDCFQIVITASAQKNGEKRRTTITEIYKIQYDHEDYNVEIIRN